MQGELSTNNQILGDLVVDLYSIETLDERFIRYAETIEELGFDAVCYSFAPRSSLRPSLQNSPIFKFSNQFPTSFLVQYEEEDFKSIDFTIREILENKLNPKDWKEYEKSGNLSEQELEVIKIAREEHGIENALSIPTMNHSIGIAGASIISFKDDESFNALKNKYFEMLCASTKAFNDIIILKSSTHLVETFVLQKLPKITPAERIVLRDLIKGVSIQRIAEEKMSTSAVSNHLQRLRKKFDVKKTSELKHLLETLNIMDYL